MEDKSLHWGEQFPHLTLNQRTFLAAFSEVSTILRAAESSGIARCQSLPRLTDPVYRRAFEHAKREAVDSLEAEARRRAVEGVWKPIFYRGEVCGWETLYSDSLMVSLLKANVQNGLPTEPRPIYTPARLMILLPPPMSPSSMS